MPKYGKQLHINAILLIGITTLIPRIFSLDNHHHLQNQRYDYIDVAKETAGSRSKGQTTRIFTTDDELDEKFWLKYLGEDFRHAVHWQVDGDNVIPLAEVKPPTPPTLNYKPSEEKRTRFVRQPNQDDVDKQLPVENLNEENDNEKEYPTEKPETFSERPTTTTTTTPSPTDKTHYSCNTLPPFNNKKPSKHKAKLLRHKKQKVIKVKPSRDFRALDEPIVVHLPETDDSVYHINEEHVPVVVQLPPVIYHQKSELQTENKAYQDFSMPKNPLYREQNSNLPFHNPNMEFYSQPLQQNIQPFYPQYSTSYATHSHQTHLSNLYNTRPLQHRFPPTQYTTHSHIKQTYPYQTHAPPLPLPPPPPPTITLQKRSLASSFVPTPLR